MRIIWLCAAALSVALLATGCRSSAHWKRDADAAAYGAVTRAQRRAFGVEDTFSVDPEAPAEQFRRRLIETQDLAIAAPVTLGSDHLTPIPRWNPDWTASSEASIDAVADTPAEPSIGLTEALGIAARGNREYQVRKEGVFRAALALDLESEAFRNTFAGLLAGRIDSDLSGEADRNSAAAESRLAVGRTLATGMRIAAALTLDLVQVLSAPRLSALGLELDTSVTFPLGRGAGRHVVAEPMVLAERELLYAVWDFEHYRADFAVEVATRYLGVLSGADQVRNAAENYQRLTVSARRARRLADAGRLPEIQVDQALQEQLRAWSRWIDTRARHADALDRFKGVLGIPPDARIGLRREDLEAIETRMYEQFPFLREGRDPTDSVSGLPADAPVPLPEPDPAPPGSMEVPEPEALARALDRRLDLRVALARIEDAQRAVIVAADGLGPEFGLEAKSVIGGRRSAASAARGDSRLQPSRGVYGALLRLDLPLRRTAERNAFRRRLLGLEQALRNAQEQEDRVKQQIRENLRALLQAREGLGIQAEAVRIARRRVASSSLFLEAGRAAVRDVLEAQEALLNAQNAWTSALVSYRLGELELYKNMGDLRVDARGFHMETTPPDLEPSP